ncbi:MAG: tetratricopeptide repeat protein [Syntrophales bacterium]|nr:tetratricopeptide repeat protein [Syntrophales bacterium]MDP3098693.1 tetratricopeptide repeat protein [Syntrophales bacterium]
MKTGMILLVITLAVLCGTLSPAAEPTVVTAEGKYVMGDLDSKKDARMLALMEAKRIALEKAGTYVESSTEVKNFSLTKDQINTLAAGVMSVDILKEDWTMSGQNMMATIVIRATIQTANLRNRITAMHDEEKTLDDSGEIRKQLAALQKELADLKAAQTVPSGGKAAAPDSKGKHDVIVTKMSALDRLEEGNKALEAGQWDQALAAFGDAIALDASLADAHAGQAAVFLQTGRKAEAMQKIDQALKLDPRSARNYAIKAQILRSQGKSEQALPLMNKAIELKPQSSKLYAMRAGIFRMLKRREAAIEDLTRACGMGNPKACEQIDKFKRGASPSGGRSGNR